MSLLRSNNSLCLQMSKLNIAAETYARFLRWSYWLKDLLNGGRVYRQYADIRKTYLGSFAESEARREKALKKLLTHAVRSSGLYKGCDPDNLGDFPIANKKFLTENHNLNLVPEDVLPWQKTPYTIQRTSGSTGTAFAIPMDSRKRCRRVAELKFYGKLVGFNSHDKLMQLRIWSKYQNKRKTQQLRENIIAWNIADLSEKKLQDLYDSMARERCVAIRGYASTLDIFAKYVRDHHLPPLPFLKIAIAGSETLYEETRTLVEQYLGCDIISQYANEENGILAQQSVSGEEKDIFHLNTPSYYFEVLKMDSDEPAEPGELGRLVITDLYNYAFPMIRYENGDCGIMQKKKDGTPYLSRIYGRVMDLVYNTKDEPVSPMTLARILKNIDGIRQWQFVQKAKGNYLVRVIPEEASHAGISSAVISEIRNYFGEDAVVDIEYVKEIPVLKSGKRKSVICEK